MGIGWQNQKRINRKLKKRRAKKELGKGSVKGRKKLKNSKK
ncbi:MAG: hypothetical protein U9Q96_02300 [Patescibacteria group bacterium]|nr:hypothetical protein [Patescibacteria group bacterium]